MRTIQEIEADLAEACEAWNVAWDALEAVREAATGGTASVESWAAEFKAWKVLHRADVLRAELAAAKEAQR